MIEYVHIIHPKNRTKYNIEDFISKYVVLDLKHQNNNYAKAAIEGTKAYIKILRSTNNISDYVYSDTMKELKEIEKTLNKKIDEEEESSEFKEFKDIKEEEQIFLRKLPKDAKSLQKVTESAFSAKTRKNLKILAEKYNITWSDCYMYSVSQRFKPTHGYIIVNDRKDINYFRTETKSPGAGQTMIYYDGKTVRMTRLINDDDQMYIKTKNSFKDFNNRLVLKSSIIERNRNASLYSPHRTQEV